MRLLLSADINARDKKGRMAIEIAKDRNYEVVIKLLTERLRFAK